jgi:hypothetical protein
VIARWPDGSRTSRASGLQCVLVDPQGLRQPAGMLFAQTRKPIKPPDVTRLSCAGGHGAALDRHGEAAVMTVLLIRSDSTVGSRAEAPRYSNSQNWRRPVFRAPRPWRASVWCSEPYLVLDLGEFTARCRACAWIGPPSATVAEAWTWFEGHRCRQLRVSLRPAPPTHEDRSQHGSRALMRRHPGKQAKARSP